MDRSVTALDTWQAASHRSTNACLTVLPATVEALIWREHKVAAALQAVLAEKVVGQAYDPLTATQVRAL